MNRRKQKFKRKLYKLTFYIVLVAAIFHFTKAYYIKQMLLPVDGSNTNIISFEIAKGSSTREIIDDLVEKDLIKSKTAFEWMLKKNDLDQIIKSGNFLLKRSYSSEEIANIITSETQAENAITIQEGLTLAQIEKKLISQSLISQGDLTNFDISKMDPEKLEQIPADFKLILETNGYKLEGLLFPDTYFISSTTFKLDDFVIRLIKTMDQKITPEMKAAIAQNGRTLYETLIMASILEREVRTENDLPIVAGILWKRYDSKWMLGADATLLYITGKQTITKDDLEMESAYNTRKFIGLPPTPIGNPGISSIEASIYTKDSPYWYYLTTLDTGEVIYAVNNDEHNTNKAKYLY